MSGDSMYPTYRDGTRVLVNLDAYLQKTPESKDVVLALHPFKIGVYIIKRVSHVTDDGRYFVVGDNSFSSSDSRGFGPLRLEKILGRVIETRSHE
ncbi:nickel-type superoxide dismutase maturation protease [[Leptolyngbya] sp. PCC 7376]|uniref:nickel-type superoxide dismutase maturation protease n=1 Tax=[Leptolyngbya] sp. PCC 7376 TaxID=111781 RepID=UPI0009005465